MKESRFKTVTGFGAAMVLTVLFISLNHLAQVRPVNDYGVLGLGRMLKKLNTTASVMMIGAHPDDEDSALLAYLARGENARTAYLSLTRGDGGQNIIGPELFESLGVIRTEELLQARRLDGAEQYFTRAFDYGFSKTLAEAKQKWPEDVIKCDVVRAIRLFRPQVVISRFSGTPNDGHGQHQYSGYISPIAVKAAADPQQCQLSGPAWQVLKFYVEQGFGANDTAALKLNTGQYDPMLGRTYYQIATEGRSQHRSQLEGRVEFGGDQFSGLNLVDSKVAPVGGKETSPFDGIDTSITGISALLNLPKGLAQDELAAAQLSAKLALEQGIGGDRSSLINQLEQHGRNSMAAMAKIVPGIDTESLRRLGILTPWWTYPDLALQQAYGVRVDALIDKETAVPGESLFVAVKTYFPNDLSIEVNEVVLQVPNGWQVIKADEPKENGPAFNRREIANHAAYFFVKIPRNAKVTQPYWLKNPRRGDLYDWPTDGRLPFDPPLITADVKIRRNGMALTASRQAEFRYADPSRGELRRSLDVVPALSVKVDHDLLIVPESDKPQTRALTITITNNAETPVSGIAGLNISSPEEWQDSASSRTFSLKAKGESTSVIFTVTVPATTKPGTYNISANAMVGESLATQTMTTIAYPHIQTHRFYSRAETTVNVLDLKAAAVNVGYIMGSGDAVPEAIRQMGLDVTMLEEKDLVSGDLSKYDTIVFGIRTSETRPDLRANNARLLEYVNNGGNLIVQYQRGNWTGLAPYPANTTDTQKTAAGGIARVVDENAKVTILQPNHPAFNFPNKITDADFQGWVQERNAYNLVTFDEKYVPLLESHDGGEQENKGGLVTAQVGKGTWTYCSYSFFRQLPAGVGGAYRLFANLLSLPKAR
jgi:LmbE family N-acetylglucosaminyl deacetylase